MQFFLVLVTFYLIRENLSLETFFIDSVVSNLESDKIGTKQNFLPGLCLRSLRIVSNNIISRETLLHWLALASYQPFPT